MSAVRAFVSRYSRCRGVLFENQKIRLRAVNVVAFSFAAFFNDHFRAAGRKENEREKRDEINEATEPCFHVRTVKVHHLKSSAEWNLKAHGLFLAF